MSQARFVQFETDVAASACWHCAESDCKTAVRVPLTDGSVVGCFCSFSCAKRWCMDEGHTEAIVNLIISNGGRGVEAAPPRHCFKRFGGAFQPPSVKSSTHVQSLHPLATPLKLTACVQSVPSGGRQDSLFREFVKQRRYVLTQAPEEKKTSLRPPKKKRGPKKRRPVEKKKKKKKPSGVPGGSLAAFIVPAG